jgi:hypothetical protein
VTPPPAKSAILTSEWGAVASGLQTRIQSPAEVEQNAYLPVTLELKSIPDSLPNGVTRFNPVLFSDHCQIRMVSLTTGKEFDVKPHGYSGPMFVDTGESLLPLDGHPLAPQAIEFPLRSAGPDLKPGDYDCTVNYSTLGTNNGLERVGPEIWAGQVVSASARVRVVPEIPRKQTILVPKRLTIDSDGQIRFHTADAEPLEIVVQNGMYLGTAISEDGNDKQLDGGPPVMDSVNAITDIDGIPPGKTVTYVIKIFETDVPPGHLWGPDERHILWAKTFSVVGTR